MQQFTVPQFIDVEDKIIGPVTTRQFVIFLGGAAIIAISYKIFDFSLFLFVSVLCLGLVALFAFVKINGRPFHFFFINLIQTLKRPRLRVWNHRLNMQETRETDLKIEINKYIPRTKEFYHSSHLARLALIVDTKGRFQGGDDEEII